MFIVVSYDITNNKRRTKIAKIMLDFGARVQYSVFECNLTDKQIETMRKKIIHVISAEEDTVRFYALCAACKTRVEVHGTGKITEDEAFIII